MTNILHGNMFVKPSFGKMMMSMRKLDDQILTLQYCILLTSRMDWGMPGNFNLINNNKLSALSINICLFSKPIKPSFENVPRNTLFSWPSFDSVRACLMVRTFRFQMWRAASTLFIKSTMLCSWFGSIHEINSVAENFSDLIVRYIVSPKLNLPFYIKTHEKKIPREKKAITWFGW